MDFNVNYSITKESRGLLAKPMGTLLEGTVEENIKKAPKWFNDNYPISDKKFNVICVGDVVSEAFIKSKELAPHLKMCLVDGQTKRKTYQIEGGKVLPNKITIENEPGTISSSATQKLKDLVNDNQKYLVWVEGEEDLLVMPLILLSKDNTYIVYGQPPITDMGTKIPAGMVIITVNDAMRKKVSEILDHFSKK
jgi:GTP-dependent dephospho-CoA kinase